MEISRTFISSLNKTSLLFFLLLVGVITRVFSTYTIESESHPPSDQVNFACSGFNPDSWTFLADGSQESTNADNLNGVTTTGDSLTIIHLTSNYEGLYSCIKDGNILKQLNLTVLGIPKFVDCPKNEQVCNLGTVYTAAIGQTIVFNVSLEFYDGGNRNKHEEVDFLFVIFGSSDYILSCPHGKDCSVPSASSKKGRISSSNFVSDSIQVAINGSSEDDSGIYRAEARIDDGGGAVRYITSSFTINVTSTIPSSTTTSIFVPTSTGSATSSLLEISSSTTSSTTSSPSLSRQQASSTDSDMASPSSSSNSPSITSSHSTKSSSSVILPSTKPSDEAISPSNEGISPLNASDNQGLIYASIIVSTVIIVVVIIATLVGCGMFLVFKAKITSFGQITSLCTFKKIKTSSETDKRTSFPTYEGIQGKYSHTREETTRTTEVIYEEAFLLKINEGALSGQENSIKTLV